MIYLLLFAVFAGAMLPLQSVINGQLGRALDSTLLAAFISFSVGTATLLVILLFRQGGSISNLQSLRTVSPMLYIGGALGVVYVTAALALVPKIGVANTTVAVIFGQVFLSLLLDHWGFFGIETRQINLPRFVGATLAFLGLILVVKN